MMRTKNGLLIGLFLLGLIILVYPHIAQPIYQKIQKVQSQEFHEKINRLPLEKVMEQINSAAQCNEAIFKNEHNLHDPFTAEFSREDYEECRGVSFDGEQFATLEIPKLDLTIPVYLGATADLLSKGVGQVDGSSVPIGGLSTHTVLAGHRGMATKAMFRNLNDLVHGDTFYIQTIHEKLRYDVYDIEVILPHETEGLVVTEGQDLASLITCHPYRDNSHRLVIHAARVN